MSSGSIIYAYVALGAQAVLPIVLGSFASVKVSLHLTNEIFLLTVSSLDTQIHPKSHQGLTFPESKNFK